MVSGSHFIDISETFKAEANRRGDGLLAVCPAQREKTLADAKIAYDQDPATLEEVVSKIPVTSGWEDALNDVATSIAAFGNRAVLLEHHLQDESLRSSYGRATQAFMSKLLGPTWRPPSSNAPGSNFPNFVFGAATAAGAAGAAAAATGPALMGLAGMFGTASTGTAIAGLSGAAANSAALAWLGGGTVAAGGGGMAAGTALIGAATAGIGLIVLAGVGAAACAKIKADKDKKWKELVHRINVDISEWKEGFEKRLRTFSLACATLQIAVEAFETLTQQAGNAGPHSITMRCCAEIVLRAVDEIYLSPERALAQDGFAFCPLLQNDDPNEWGMLEELLGNTDGNQLGKGKDHPGDDPYNKLCLASAWRIVRSDMLDLKYEAASKIIHQEIQTLNRNEFHAADVKTDSILCDCDLNLDRNLNEVMLLHGTKPECVRTVILQGLNERFAGTSSGSAFGEAIYLAEDAGKTDQYVTVDVTNDQGNEETTQLHRRLYGPENPHRGNVFYIIVCRVTLGCPVRTQEYGRGARSMDTGERIFPISFRELATVPGVDPPVHYHSLIAELGGSIARYREFILTHGERIRPEYVIAYQRYNGDKLIRCAACS